MNKKSLQPILASLGCIFAGMIVGFFVMLFLSISSEYTAPSDAFLGFGKLLIGPFGSGNFKMIQADLGNMIFYSVPIIFTGLSVAIAFKTGLFNIGAPGQYLMGIMGSLLVALSIHASTGFGKFMVWVLALIVGALLGALWGAIPGAFKSLLKVNEVIVCIMTNWIAANIVTWVFSKTNLQNVSMGKTAYLVTTSTTGASTPTLGLDKLLKGSYVDCGILIAILVAVGVYILLNKTVFGYELKACGYNKNASIYAGMNAKRNIILSMAIAGGLSAMGGALYYLNPGIEFNYLSVYMSLPATGFNGIPVALLAGSNPLGVIFSGVLLQYLAMGGQYLQGIGFNKYIADIIVAVIIYFAGFVRLITELIQRAKTQKAEKKENLASVADENHDKNSEKTIKKTFSGIIETIKSKFKKTFSVIIDKIKSKFKKNNTEKKDDDTEVKEGENE